MYHQLVNQLALKEGGIEEAVSQPVSIGGDNHIKVSTTVYNITGTVTYVVEQSNDLQNWSVVDGTANDTMNSVGYDDFPALDVTAAYVRVKFSISQTTNDVAVLAAGINTTSQ